MPWNEADYDIGLGSLSIDGTDIDGLIECEMPNEETDIIEFKHTGLTDKRVQKRKGWTKPGQVPCLAVYTSTLWAFLLIKAGSDDTFRCIRTMEDASAQAFDALVMPPKVVPALDATESRIEWTLEQSGNTDQS